jgi:hypothetical protein
MSYWNLEHQVVKECDDNTIDYVVEGKTPCAILLSKSLDKASKGASTLWNQGKYPQTSPSANFLIFYAEEGRERSYKFAKDTLKQRTEAKTQDASTICNIALQNHSSRKRSAALNWMM